MDKKTSPDYKKLCGMIPIQLFLDFKKWCIDQNKDLSEALEIAVSDIMQKSAKKQKSDDNSQ